MSKNNSITFLGTGTSQGIPVISCRCEVCLSSDPRDKRLRTSALVHYQGHSFLIDAGPDFRQQMLREDVRSLDAILLTHQHKDHTGGLDDVRAFNYCEETLYQVCTPFPIYCEPRVLDSLKMEYPYVFSEQKYPGIPAFDIHVIGNEPFAAGEVEIIPIRAMHYRLPVLGFRFGPMAYITDANHIPEEELEKLRGLDVLVLSTVRLTKHISHFSLPEAVAMAEKIGARKTYLTHLSHQLPVHEKLMQLLPDGVEPAYDGLKIEF